MLRIIWKRISSAFLVLFAASFFTFFLSRIVPNDPALAYIGGKTTAADEQKVRTLLGLDQPLPIQYFKYLRDMLKGNWGYSLSTKQPVLTEILHRLPATLELIFFAVGFALLIGIICGIISARKPHGFASSFIRVSAIAGISVPAFWLGLLLQLLFVGKFHIFPATGEFDIDIKFTNPIHHITGFPLLDSLITGNFVALTSGLKHMVLPALTLSAYSFGLIARMSRGNLLEVLGQEYINVARANGISERLILFKLALKNAIPPVITVTGLSTAYLITGTFFVEQVYGWPGIGGFAANSLISVDYPAIMGITILGAVGYLVINFLVDIIYAKLDPRVKL